MSTRPIGLSTSQVSAVRILAGTPAGAPIASDPTSWIDANLPKTPDPTNGGAVDTTGFATIWLGVEFTGGAGNTIVLAPLVRDDGAADGQRWKHLLVGGGPQLLTLTGAGFIEARVEGRLVFPCLVAVLGAPTGATLLAFPGKGMGGPPSG